MKRSLMASIPLAALLAGAAIAQQAPYPKSTEVVPTPEKPPSTPNIPPAHAATQSGDMANKSAMPTGPDMLADKIQGLTVYAPKEPKDMTKSAAPAQTTMPARPAMMESKTVSKDEYKKLQDSYQSIGEIGNLVIGMDGEVKQAVVSVGGFLGVGERDVALQWQDIRFVRSTDGDTFAYVAHTKAELEKLPEYKMPKK